MTYSTAPRTSAFYLQRGGVFRLLATIILVGAAAVTAEAGKPAATPTPTPAPVGGRTFYVDSSAAASGSGSQASPWNSLVNVTGFAFGPGDSILLRRGTTITGPLTLQRSGSSTQPIVIGAYGDGARPIVDGAGGDAAVRLNNTSYVTVQGLEIKNGRTYGLLATSSIAGVVNGLTLRDLDVHDVTGGAMTQKYTGLVVVTPGVKGSKFNQVLIDGVVAHNTTLWSGIMVYGTYLTGDHRWEATAKDVTKRSSKIIIRNSIAHDTYGDGIVAYCASGVLLERNLVYRSGMEPTQTIGTPNAIWSWASNDVTVQDNEAFDNHSPGVDGGGLDIDYWSTNTIVQYNYAHDNQAYGIGIFGAESTSTVNSIVRYNIFANNGLKKFGDGAEEIYIATWNRGKLDGVQIYNNTVYATGRGAVGTMANAAPVFGPQAPLFKNNVVVSTAANVLGTGMAHVPFERDYNLYFYTAGSLNGTEAHSIYNVDPRLNGMGYHAVGFPGTQWTLASDSPAVNRGVEIPGAPATDFFGGPALLGGTRDIGADELR